MKFLSFWALVLPLLFAGNCFSQNTIKEQLKTAEQSSSIAKLDTVVYNISDIKTINSYDSIGLNAFQSLDSLLVFVAAQKQIPASTFDTNIKPYLEKKLLELDTKTLDFTDEEDLIFESFITILNYNNAISIVKIYEELIVKNYKDLAEMATILTVLSYIKYVCFYLSKQTTNALFYYTNNCFAVDLKSYNTLNWKVFALNPGAMLLWVTAACAWDYMSEK